MSKRSDRIRDAMMALDEEQLMCGVLFFATTRTFTDRQWTLFLERCRHDREALFRERGWIAPNGQGEMPAAFRLAMDTAFSPNTVQDARLEESKHFFSAEMRLTTVRGLYKEGHLPQHRRALQILAEQFDSLCRRSLVPAR